MSNSLWPHGLYSPWNSPGQNTGVGSLSLLQGIFPTQGSNPGLPHCRGILYQLSHKGSPDVKNWLTGKDPDAGKDWRQEEKGDNRGWDGCHHRLDGHEFEQALEVGNGQGSLACCSPWGHKEWDTTERLNGTELNCKGSIFYLPLPPSHSGAIHIPIFQARVWKQGESQFLQVTHPEKTTLSRWELNPFLKTNKQTNPASLRYNMPWNSHFWSGQFSDF